MKRKHSKIDKLPSDIKEAVEQMILGDYTYRDVCNFVRDTANVTLSEAAVCRYAQGLNASVQEIRLASENMRALTEEMQKFPQLDTTEGIARLISHKVLQAVQQMDEIALKEADPLKLIEKAILTSELGINPQNDGRVIRLVFPQLTEERRKELAKQVRKYGEEAKVAVRNIRRDAMDKFKAQKKKSEITEDDLKIIEKDLQKLTDDYIKEVERIADEKEKELMEI